MRLLLIEDEVALARVIRRGLEGANFSVDHCENGKEGLETALAGSYDLLILDLMLPDMDGWQICEELRSRRKPLPILMLTARGAVEDRVRGLELGADDYLPKPFEFPELLARVRALLRRDKVNKTRVIRIADMEIDTAQRKVSRMGIDIPLSDREYTLLEALAQNEGRILTREVIQERVWQDFESYSNTVDVYVSMLRKKVDVDFPAKLIHTIRNVGYTLRRPEEPH